jgi:hypothetical protein
MAATAGPVVLQSVLRSTPGSQSVASIAFAKARASFGLFDISHVPPVDDGRDVDRQPVGFRHFARDELNPAR